MGIPCGKACISSGKQCKRGPTFNLPCTNCRRGKRCGKGCIALGKSCRTIALQLNITNRPGQQRNLTFRFIDLLGHTPQGLIFHVRSSDIQRGGGHDYALKWTKGGTREVATHLVLQVQCPDDIIQIYAWGTFDNLTIADIFGESPGTQRLGTSINDARKVSTENLLGLRRDGQLQGGATSTILLLPRMTGSIDTLLRPSMNDRKDIIASVTRAVNCLSTYGYIHGDLHPRNILYSLQNGLRIFRLSDFGKSKKKKSPTRENDRALQHFSDELLHPTRKQ